MKEELYNHDNYLFFLQLTPEKPDYYFDLAEKFSRYNIFLLPVTPQELSELARGKVSDVLIVTDSVKTQRNLQKVQKLYLDFGLLNRRFRLYHVGSFSELSIAHRLKKFNNYHFYPLPMLFDQIVKSVATFVYQEKKLLRRWPGGKRAKLPAQR